MSVLINGMEMPKDCGHCRFAVDGWCYAYGRANIDALSTYERTNYCPLVPVPPHGRLIDADALGIGKCNPEVFDNKNYANGWNNAIEILQNAPTILETEGEK